MFRMTNIAEIIQGILALAIVTVDAILHLKGATPDGFDTWSGIIVALYFGGKLVQVVQGNQAHGPRSTDTAPPANVNPAQQPAPAATTPAAQPAPPTGA